MDQRKAVYFWQAEEHKKAQRQEAAEGSRDGAPSGWNAGVSSTGGLERGQCPEHKGSHTPGEDLGLSYRELGGSESEDISSTDCFTQESSSK